MNKIKAIFTLFCVITLYYIIRPINCFFEALLESRLMHLGFFKEVFMLAWEEDGAQVDYYWNSIKELWNET